MKNQESNRFLLPNRGRMGSLAGEIIRCLDLSEDFHPRRLYYRFASIPGEVLLVRCEDIPDLIGSRVAAAGITGLDYVAEGKASINVVCELDSCAGEIMFLVAVDAEYSNICELPQRSTVVSQYPRIAREAMLTRGREDISVLAVRGAAETYVAAGFAAGAIDVVSTGVTSRVNKLKAVERIGSTCAVLVTPGKTGEETEFLGHILRAVRPFLR